MNDVIQVKHSTSSITFTETAKQHIVNYLSKKNGLGLRMSVKKTGCSGLSYVIDYVESVDSNDLEFPLVENYKLYVDRKSYPVLKGVSVDYIKQGINYKFVFENPNQTGQCGCGESFTTDK